MNFLFLLIAAGSGALFHLAFRKSLDGGGRGNAFLFLQSLFSTPLLALLAVLQTGHLSCDSATFGLGMLEGAIYVGMMWLMARAFQQGPSGLTVATLNSAAVMPAIIMALLFGSSFGHGYTPFNALGSLLVIVGLFLAARSSQNFRSSKITWLLFALLAFMGHTIYLSLIAWRSLLLKTHTAPLPYFVPELSLQSAPCFPPLIFFSAALLYGLLYFFTDRRPFSRRELLWGGLGALGNTFCTFFLILATEMATGAQKAMVFPIVGVISIFICALWGRLLYQEKIHWQGNALCLTGVTLGSIDWTTVL